MLFEHEKSRFQALDTGLDIARTERFVMVEVVSRPRETSAKVPFYDSFCTDLENAREIASNDVMIFFILNSDADWSFGNGRAQFTTGELH